MEGKRRFQTQVRTFDLKNSHAVRHFAQNWIEPKKKPLSKSVTYYKKMRLSEKLRQNVLQNAKKCAKL